jgi:hypothetical protein
MSRAACSNRLSEPTDRCQRDIVRRGTESILWPAGHRIESTVRYLEVDDALEIAEKIDV